MQRKFFTNVILLLILNFLIKPVWILGIEVRVQNVVGAEDFGFYFSLLNASFLFNILLDFGITRFNNINIAQNEFLLNKYFSGIVILKFLLALVYFGFTLGFALVFNYSAAQIKMLLLIGFNQFLLSFILYLRSNISGLLMLKTDSLLSVLDRFLMIIFCGILLYGNILDKPFRIEWFVYTQTLAYVISALIASVIVILKAEFKRLSWNRAFFLLILKQSYPFAVLTLLMTFYNRIDTVMIERILSDVNGKQESGIYAMPYRLLDSVNQLPYLFSVFLIPIFAKMIKIKSPVEEMVKLSFSLLFLISVSVAAGTYLYSYEIIDFLYDDHILYASQIFRVLMLGFIPVSTIYIFGTLLTANGNLKMLNIVAGSAMIINIVLNFILIPHYKALGSASASLFTQFLSALLQVILVQKIFRFRINYRYLLSLVLFLAVAILISSYMHFLPLSWYMRFLILIALLFVFATIIKLVNVKALFLMIVRERS